VTEILLGGMGLNGNIPKQLGSLTNLQSLDLSDNRLTGSIAAELLDLANLQELYLGGNLLTGCVPDGLRDVPNNDIARLGLPFCSEHPCVSGGAVVDATNTGLVSDCGMLLAARDTLAGTASLLAGTAALNWSADTPIADWTGVALGEASGRVTEILLGGMGLCVSGSDCGMLLAARDTLAGTASLNWSADTPIADWTGVALGEASGRVCLVKRRDV
jgi:hypothetical protein